MSVISLAFTLPRWSVAVTRYVKVAPAICVPEVSLIVTFVNVLPKLSFAVIPSASSVISSLTLKLVVLALLIDGVP